MSQSTDDGNIWGDTSSSFEEQLYRNAALAEQKVNSSQQPRSTNIGQFQAKAPANKSSTTWEKDNAFHVYRDPQPSPNMPRDQQRFSSPLGDLSNINRPFNPKAHFNTYDSKKQKTAYPPKYTKLSTDTVAKKEGRPCVVENAAARLPPSTTTTATTKADYSADDEDDYMWMEFDVDLNALLESVEAKSTQLSAQLNSNDDLILKQNDEHQDTTDQQHTSLHDDDIPKVDEEHVESNLSKFGGFMTAGSKKMLNTDPEARKKALTLFKDSPNKQYDDTPVQEEVHVDILPPPTSLGGFTTASGKTMSTPTKEAISKAERLLSETNDTPASPSHHIKSLVSRPVIESNVVNKNTAPSESDSRFAESLQRGKKRTMNDLEEDHIEFKYESVLSLYGGFKTGNNKGDFTVSTEAKRQAVALFNASESARDLTQSTQSQRIPCSPPRSESTDSSQQQQQLPLSPLFPGKNDSYLNTEWINSPEMSPESKLREEKTKIAQTLVSNISNIPRPTKRLMAGSFKQLGPFKSPIIEKNIELTKAAVYRHAPSTIPRKGPCVFKMKASGPRASLKDFGKPGVFTRSQLLAMNIPSAAVDMTAARAKDHRFYGWGPQDARDAMIRAGALEKFLPMTWVENHYSWIVWKVAGMMRSFPRQLKDWWSPKKVLEQLLYRYEREVNLGHRSALKRIIEQDDVPGKLMALVIVDIVKRTTGSPNQTEDAKRYELLLSDGWYKVSATADARLERAISKGRLAVGHKLAICGAQISTGPQAHSSGVAPSNIVLSISSNGCHIAPWDAKLGYQRRRLLFRSLNTLHYDGGIVTAIDVIVCRKYPIMYSETLSDGSIIVRTAREEEEARQESMSRLYGSSSNEWALAFSEYPQSLMSQQYSDVFQDKDVPKPLANEERKVSGYFRVRVSDFPTGNRKPTMTATLLQLDANEVLHMDICEGNRYRVFFLIPYSPKSKRHPGLNLKTTRKTRWEPVTSQRGPAQLAAASLYVPRHITPCDKLRECVSEEADMVVVVLCVNSTEKRRQASGRTIWYQKLLVTDGSKALVQANIRLAGRPLSHIEGQVIAFTNAQFEMYDAKYEVTHMRISEESEIVTKSSSLAGYLQKAISSLREWIQQDPQSVETLKQHINEKLLLH